MKDSLRTHEQPNDESIETVLCEGEGEEDHCWIERVWAPQKENIFEDAVTLVRIGL